MQTAEERVKFAIQFIQLDFDRLRPGDWLNLREDLMNFLFPEGALAQMHIYPPDLPEEHSVAAIQLLRQDVTAILDAVVMCGEDFPPDKYEDGPVPRLVSPSPQLSVRPTFVLFPEQRPGQLILTWLGPFRDAFLMQLITSLIQLPLDTLRRCPECGMIFFRVRKQEYCKRQCVHRANIRKWRQTDAGKKYERERSHTRYKDRVQESLGANVSVRRRPRSRKQQAED
jgi:hypothetical protein